MKFHGDEIVTPNGSRVPLSAAIEVDGLVYLSGVLALRDGNIAGNIEEQTDVVFDLIEATLVRAGLSLDHVIKTTVWLTDPRDFMPFNAVYGRRLGAPFPSRSCVISQLVAPDARVEIEVVASRNGARIQAIEPPGARSGTA